MKSIQPLSEMGQSIAVGSLYEHYKKKRYQILAIARHSESLQEMVVYQALYGERDVWVRPVSMFLETVVVDGVTQSRFNRVHGSSPA